MGRLGTRLPVYPCGTRGVEDVCHLEDGEKIYFGSSDDISAYFDGTGLRVDLPEESGIKLVSGRHPQIAAVATSINGKSFSMRASTSGIDLFFPREGKFAWTSAANSSIGYGTPTDLLTRFWIDKNNGEIVARAIENTSSDAFVIKVNSDIFTAHAFEIRSGPYYSTDVFHVNKNGTLGIDTLGDAVGISFTGITADEPIIKANAESISGSGNVKYQIAIDIGGTKYYLYAYEAGY